MPVRKQTGSNGSGVQITSTKKSVPVNRSDVIDAANATDNPDGYKYQAAVAMARDSFQDNPKVSEREFKQAIDDIYSTMGATKTASEVRGENAFTQAIEGMKNGLDDFNIGIGNGIDAAWDTVFGGIGDALLGKEGGDVARNMFDGSDIAWIPDLIEDIGIGMIPGVGLPAVVAKNLVQNSDNFYEGMFGRDAITQEKLDDGQRAMKMLSGGLNTALASMPAWSVNKARKAAGQTATDAVKEAANNVSYAVRRPKEALANMGSNEGLDSVQRTINSVVDSAGTAKRFVKHPIKTGRELTDKALDKAEERILKKQTAKAQKLNNEAGKELEALLKEAEEKGLSIENEEIASAAREILGNPEYTMKKKAANIAAQPLSLVSSGMTSALPGIATAGTAMTAAEMAESGIMNPFEAAGNALLRNQGQVPLFAIAPFALGTRRLANKGRGITGKRIGEYKPGTALGHLADGMPYHSARAAAVAGANQDIAASENTGRAVNGEELLKRLQALRAS